MQKLIKSVIVGSLVLCASVALADNPYANYLKNTYINTPLVTNSTVFAAGLITATNTAGARADVIIVNTNVSSTVLLYADPIKTNTLIGVVVGGGASASWALTASSNVWVYDSKTVPDISGTTNNSLGFPIYARSSTNLVSTPLIVIEHYENASGVSPVIQQ